MVKRDIVYFVGDNLLRDGAELKYSLRTLQNLPHRKVWIATNQLPDWITNIHWLQTPEPEDKWTDLYVKYLALAQYDNPDMLDDVYVMDDDQYLTKPLDEVPVYHQEYTKRIADYRGYLNSYGAILYKTLRLLKNLGYENPWQPCMHTPMPVTRSQLPVEWDDGKGPYEWKVLWLTKLHEQGVETPRMFAWDPKVHDKIQLERNLARPEGYLSSDEARYITSVLNRLDELFPEKSDYEL